MFYDTKLITNLIMLELRLSKVVLKIIEKSCPDAKDNIEKIIPEVCLIIYHLLLNTDFSVNELREDSDNILLKIESVSVIGDDCRISLSNVNKKHLMFARSYYHPHFFENYKDY